MSLVWYALRTKPLSERKALTGLLKRGFTVYLPVETKWRRARNNTRERHDRPLIPGYLFLGVGPWQALYFALQVESVHDVVGVGGEARAIDGKFVYDLQARQAAGEFDHTPARRLPLNKGDRCRILTGPFRDQIGKLVEADNEGRVRLLLSGLFSGGIALDSDAIEAADQPVKAA